MHRIVSFFAAVLVAGMGAVAWGQGVPSGKLALGVDPVKATPALEQAVAAKGSSKVLSMQRVLQSMDGQLIDRFHNTGKFQLVSRSDLNAILSEQQLVASGNIDTSDANAAKSFLLAGCKYLCVVTVDDFQDLNEELKGEGGVVIAVKRTVRLSSVAKIYDTTTGKLLQSANFQLTNGQGKETQFGVSGDGRDSDTLLVAMARQMADRVANRVLDVLFPARVIARTDNRVTINRGEGTGIDKSQVWKVFAVGEALIDPDTGESLGAEEVPVGSIRIISITPKFAVGEVVEDFGIDKLHVARLLDE